MTEVRETNVPVTPLLERLPYFLGLDGPMSSDTKRELKKALLSQPGALTDFVATLARRGDVETLTLLQQGSTQLHLALAGFLDRSERGSTGESALLRVVRIIAGLGLLLVDDRPGDAELTAALDWYGAAGTANPPEEGLSWRHWTRRGRTRLSVRLGQAKASGSSGAGTVAELLTHLAERPPRPAAGWIRTFIRWFGFGPPSIGVLYDDHNVGGKAKFVARRVRGRQFGLVPDPARMVLFLPGEGFAEALHEAWKQAGRQLNGTVLWSLEGAQQPVRQMAGGSMGAGFAVVFKEAARLRTRGSGLWTLRRLVTANYVIGAIDDAGRLVKVDGYDTKVPQVPDDGRVIVPHDDLKKAVAQRLGRNVEVVPAITWEAAAELARTRSRAAVIRLIAVVGVPILVLGLTGFGLYQLKNADTQQTLRWSSTVASESASVALEDPPLSALLALESYDIAPDSAHATDAMYRIAENNTFVTRNLSAHSGQVSALAQSPDGRTLYSAGRDGTLAAWDTASGKRLTTIHVGTTWIQQLAVHPFTSFLVSTDSKGGVQLWRTDGPGRLSRPVVLTAETSQNSASTAPVIAGAGFFSDGSRVYAISGAGEVRVWDPVTQQVQSDWWIDSMPGARVKAKNRTTTVTAVADMSVLVDHPKSVTVATAGGEILDIDLALGRADEVLANTGLGASITTLAANSLGPDGKLAIGTDRGVQWWDVSRKQRIVSPGDTAQSVTGLAYTSNTSGVVVGTRKGVQIVPADSQPSAGPSGLSGYFGGPAAVISAGGGTSGLIAVGHDDGTIAILDPQNHRTTQMPAEPSTVTAFDGTGRLLVTNALAKTFASGMQIIRPAAGPIIDLKFSTSPRYKPLVEMDPDPSWLNATAYFFVNKAVLTDRLAIVAGQVTDTQSRHGAVLVWDSRTGAPLRKLDFPGGDPDLVSEVAYVPRLAAIVARNTDGTLRAWSTSTWQPLFDVTVGRGGGLAISPDGTTAVLPVQRDEQANNQQGTLAFVDLRSKAVRSVDLPYQVIRAAFTPKGNRLAVLSNDNRMRILTRTGTAESGAPDIPLPAQPEDLAFSPDGQRVAATLDNGQTLVFDTETGALKIPPLIDSNGYFGTSPVWDKDGDLLAMTTGYLDAGHPIAGPVQLWHTKRLSWRTQMCGLAGREITKAEWKRYVPGESYAKLCTDLVEG